VTTKTLDSKGRVTLGARFAGQTVVIDDSNPTCITIKPVVMIPADEAWLYKNQTAINLIRQGLEEARSGKFAVSNVDMDADLEWSTDVED